MFLIKFNSMTLFILSMITSITILSSCVSIPSTSVEPVRITENAIQNFSIEKCQTVNPVKTFPHEKQIWNESLYNILKKTKAKSIVKTFKSYSVSTIEIYDVLCVLNPPAAEGENNTTTTCEYWTLSKNQKAALKVVLQGENAEALRQFLFDFPVKQGDSGASTAFIRCEKADGMNVDCQMAVTLNYEGPS